MADWAKLFKATTWEEIKMLANKNEYLDSTLLTLLQMTEDERIQERARERDDYIRDIKSYQRGIAERDAKLKEKDSMILERDSMISERDSMISERDSMISERNSMISERNSIISEKDALIESLISERNNHEAEISRLRAQLQDSRK